MQGQQKCETLSKNKKAKGVTQVIRVPASQAQGPEFKP
jgi:hypothetical protein